MGAVRKKSAVSSHARVMIRALVAMSKHTPPDVRNHHASVMATI